jgi:hypothetical protein
MALFSKTPTKKFEQVLAEIGARLSKLTAKRDTAAAELETAQAARHRFAIAGDSDDDEARSKLQAGIRRRARPCS